MVKSVSLTVCPLVTKRIDKNGDCLASAFATGFLWRKDSEILLLTNLHVVTGVNPLTNIVEGFIPNVLSIGIKYEHQKFEGGRMLQTLWIDRKLYNEEEPEWLEHPTGRSIDCCCISILPAMQNLAAKFLNEIDFQGDLKPEVSMDCFVVGYPRGLSGTGWTPIWKRASVATEPTLNYQGLPKFLVDTATREGMSGSPVLIRHSGIHMPSGKFTDDSVIGTVENFVGMYSGRVGTDELGVQLGVVWMRDVVEATINEGRRGVNPNSY